MKRQQNTRWKKEEITSLVELLVDQLLPLSDRALPPCDRLLLLPAVRDRDRPSYREHRLTEEPENQSVNPAVRGSVNVVLKV